MIFLALKLASAKTSRTCIARAWVNTEDGEQAVTRVSAELASAGWKLESAPEWEATTTADYFPPCESLDAFNRALQEEIVILY